jgi:uncharacterized membrane protein
LWTEQRRRVALIIDGLLFTSLAVWMTVYVASEDSYRKLGVSRWNTYGAKPLTVIAIAASVLTAVLAGYAAAWSPRLLRLVLIAGVVSLVLNYTLLTVMSN